MTVDIKRFSKAEVLRRLFNAATPKSDDCKFEISLEEAEELVKQTPNLYFGDVYGKRLGINISGDFMSGHDYDVINRSPGLCAHVLAND